MAILSGQKITATMLEKMANVPRCRAVQGTLQSIPNNTFTSLNFETEEYKYLVGHNTSGNTTFFSCQVAGLYRLSGGAYFAQHGTGIRALKWQKNAVDIPASGSTQTSFSTGQPGVVARTIEVELAVADFVTLMAFQNSGGALDTYVAADYARSDMSIELIRDNSL